MLEYLKERIFPMGFGTRAILAFALVAAAITVALKTGEVDRLYTITEMVVAFYFAGKLANGTK